MVQHRVDIQLGARRRRRPLVSPDVGHDRLCGRKCTAEVRYQFCSGHVTSIST